MRILFFNFRTFDAPASLIHELALKLPDDNLHITVRRSKLLCAALREGLKSKFNAKLHIKVVVLTARVCMHNVSLLQVTFAGESAIDMGGPKREFFRLFAEEAYMSPFFQGGTRSVLILYSRTSG